MISRRALLGSAATAVGVAVLKTRADALRMPILSSQASDPDPPRAPGRGASELGQRALAEQPRRLVYSPAPSGGSLSPLQDLDGILTPSDLHFERHHGGIPVIDPGRYRLLIHGMVERPTGFALRDLKRFPAVSRICFIECSGNGSSAYRKDASAELTPQQIDGLTSTSEWVGVPLATLLREVGVKPGATWFLAEGEDAPLMSRSIPLQKAWDDALVVYGQNGEALRPEQGYPVRLLLPGWEGNAQVKWIRRIELSDGPFMTRDETSKYTDPLINGTARMFSFVMDAKSIITFPSYPYVLPERGWWEIRGIAWSGRGRVTRVEVSTDRGRSWQPAELQEPVLPKCHTRFRHLWSWDGRETTLQSRAVDETGYVQPTLRQLMTARGEGTFYHTNQIRPWKVHRDGQVVFGPWEAS